MAPRSSGSSSGPPSRGAASWSRLAGSAVVAGRLGVADLTSEWSFVHWSAHDPLADDALLSTLEREVADGALTLAEVAAFGQNEDAHGALVRAVERLLSVEARIEPDPRRRLAFMKRAAGDLRVPSFAAEDISSGMGVELFLGALRTDLPLLTGGELLELAADLAGADGA